jgi:beta-phosphoglucomutase-like phosphatase (HAD superfamily)
VEKMNVVYEVLPQFRELFDTVVDGDMVSKSKPDPECYLTAAKELGVAASSAFVFEDSFMGLESGRAAGMRVIGVTTTNSEEALRGKCHAMIKDFTQFNYEKMMAVTYHQI